MKWREESSSASSVAVPNFIIYVINRALNAVALVVVAGGLMGRINSWFGLLFVRSLAAHTTWGAQ